MLVRSRDLDMPCVYYLCSKEWREELATNNHGSPRRASFCLVSAERTSSYGGEGTSLSDWDMLTDDLLFMVRRSAGRC